MTIHHATLKRATAEGIALVETDTAFGPAILAAADPITLHRKAATALDAAILMRMLKAEYPALVVTRVAEDGGEGDPRAHFRVEDRGGEHAFYVGEELPKLADVLEACEEAGFDPTVAPEGEEEDEDERSGSVVPIVYKQRYAERGNPANCGDWLAVTLETYCHVAAEKGRGKFDLEAFETILTTNGVPLGPWATNRNPGWQGRFRMSGRNVLAKTVAAKGFLFVPGEITGDGKDAELAAPEEWVRENMPKPKATRKSKKAAVEE